MLRKNKSDAPKLYVPPTSSLCTTEFRLKDGKILHYGDLYRLYVGDCLVFREMLFSNIFTFASVDFWFWRPHFVGHLRGGSVFGLRNATGREGCVRQINWQLFLASKDWHTSYYQIGYQDNEETSIYVAADDGEHCDDENRNDEDLRHDPHPERGANVGAWVI